MCGRYSLQEDDYITERFNSSELPGLKPRFNAAPTQMMPVIIQDGEKRSTQAMRWGLLPGEWAKKYPMFNARSEEVFDKRVWKKIILERRCLVPANGFIEWQHLTDKKTKGQPWYIHLKQKGLFAFAGVWTSWQDKDDNEWRSYSILTTEPNKEMAKLHDRMPVILHPEAEATWLEPSNDDRGSIEPLLRPLEDDALGMFKLGTDINYVKNDYESLIYPMNSL